MRTHKATIFKLPGMLLMIMLTSLEKLKGEPGVISGRGPDKGEVYEAMDYLFLTVNDCVGQLYRCR